MDLFTYLLGKNGKNTHRDLFSYLLGKNAGGSGTYTTFSGTSLNISNTLQAKIKNIALEGNTSQDGTPTPDTPIPIKVVTGEQSIEIKNSDSTLSQTYPLSLGNIELAKIGNYKDYIFKNIVGSPYYNADLDLNEWYLYKIIDKLTLNGSETYIYQLNHARFLYAHNISNLSFDNINKSLCNYFVYGVQNNNIFINNSYIYFYTSNFTSADNFKSFVQEKYENGNALTVYVPLTTPTNTKITDTTLIQQLENINNNARSYKDTTIIECTSASTDNETIGFSGEIKVTSVSLGNSLNTSLLSSNLQEETNTNDIQEEPNLDEIENDEPIENEVS